LDVKLAVLFFFLNALHGTKSFLVPGLRVVFVVPPLAFPSTHCHLNSRLFSPLLPSPLEYPKALIVSAVFSFLVAFSGDRRNALLLLLLVGCGRSLALPKD